VRIFFEPIDDAGNAIFDECHLEVDEQAQSLVGEPEIGQKLLPVNRSEDLDRFYFDNHLVFDDQIGPESGVDADILVDYWDRLLPNRPESPAIQFVISLAMAFSVITAFSILTPSRQVAKTVRPKPIAATFEDA
jgi:hypothetical protein